MVSGKLTRGSDDAVPSLLRTSAGGGVQDRVSRAGPNKAPAVVPVTVWPAATTAAPWRKRPPTLKVQMMARRTAGVRGRSNATRNVCAPVKKTAETGRGSRGGEKVHLSELTQPPIGPRDRAADPETLALGKWEGGEGDHGTDGRRSD